MNFQEFLDKHRQFKKAVRTYIMLFEASGLESYLDYATKVFTELTIVHKEFREKTGCCPREALLENHLKESEHRAKVIELELEREKTRKAKIEATETETLANRHGKVRWKKGA